MAAAAAAAALRAPSKPSAMGSSKAGAAPDVARAGMTQGDPAYSMPFPRTPVGGSSANRGGEPGALSVQTNAPLFTTIQHHAIKGDITEKFQPHELLFTRTGAHDTTYSDTKPPTGTISSSKNHFMTLTAINKILDKNRDVPGYRSFEWVTDTFVPVGVAAAIQGHGWSQNLMSPSPIGAAGSASMVNGGEYHIIDYTAAYDKQIAQKGLWLACELRMVKRTQGFNFTADKLGVDGAGEKGIRDRIAVIMSPNSDQKGVLGAVTDDPRLDDVAADKDRFQYPPERADARYVMDAMEQKRLYKENEDKFDSEYFLQYVVTVCQSPCLETPTDSAATLLWGAPPPHRFIIGRIVDLSKQKSVKGRPDILFPGADAVTGPNFNDIGLLTVKFNITRFQMH